MYLTSVAFTSDQICENHCHRFSINKAMLMHIGGIAVNGLGLKVVLNEMKDRDE